MNAISKKQRLTMYAIYFMTTIILIHSMYFGYVLKDFCNIEDIIFFIILTAVAESLTVVFKNLSFSLSFIINIVCYVLFGPCNSLIILTFGYLCRVIKVEKGRYIHVFNTPIYGTVFNCCGIVLPLLVANYFYIFLGGSFLEFNIIDNVLPLVIFSLIYFLLNMIIMTTILAVKSNKNIILCLHGNLGMGILNTVLMIPLSILMIELFQRYSYIGIIVLIFIFSFVRYTLQLYSNSKEQFAETVTALMNAVEARDQYTNGHSKRVAAISTEIAKKMGLSIWEIEKIHVAAMLHDVGKIGISDTILQKPGKLTEEEFAIIKSHPEIGINIIKDIKNIEYVFPIVRHHHERYDGNGYPDKKGGDELSLSVYIVQLADSVDAMASNRPYRAGLSNEMIIKEIENGMETQFHPKVASTYLKILKERE